jgi:hypothetical protein
MNGYNKNMKKYILYVVIPVILIGVILIIWESSNKQTQQESLALQSECANQSQTFYNNYTSEQIQNISQMFPAEAAEMTYTYTDHYNGALNKCFILINRQEGLVGENRIELFDAFENKEYALYDMDPAVKGPYCTIEDKQCSSKTEFDTFVETYMQG